MNLPTTLPRLRGRSPAIPLAAAHSGAALAGASILLALLVRVPFLDWPLTADEGGYAYGAVRWFHHGLTMYSDDLWFDRPQGIFVAYEVGMRLLGDSVPAIRLMGAIWAAATAALVALLARSIFDSRTAWLAGLGYAVVSAAPQVEGFIANAEIFMLLPGTAAVWCIWHRRFFSAGLLTGAALLLKPSAAPLALFAVVWLIHDREHWRAWLAFAIGGAILPTVGLIHGLLSVGLHDYLHPVLLFRLETGSTSNTGLRFIAGWYYTAPVWFPLLVLSVPGWRALRGTRERRFLGLWVLASLAGVAMGGNWFQHYMLQLLPPLLVIVARSLGHVSDQFPVPSSRQPAVVIAVVSIAAAAFIGPWLSLSPADGADRVFRGNPGYAVNQAVADYLIANTTEADTIYVALAQADIVYLSDRQSAVPSLYLQQVVEYPPAFDAVVASLRDREPAFVVLMHREFDGYEAGGPILDAIAAGYVLDRWFGDDVEVLRRR